MELLQKLFLLRKQITIKEVELKGNLVELTNNFNKGWKVSPFQNSGLLIDGKVITIKTEAIIMERFTV